MAQQATVHGSRIVRACLSLALLATLICCNSPFAPETLVERLRILGVRAEPLAVGPSDSTTLDALVVDPKGEGRPLVYTWAVCLLEIDSQAQDIPCPGPDTYPLPGNGPSTTLSMPQLIAWAAEQGFDLDGQGVSGLPEDQASVPLLIGLRVDAGGESVRALKRVVVILDPSAEAYTNPQLVGLEMDGDPSLLSPGEHVDLRPSALDSGRDIFLPIREDEERPEDLLFSWFSTTGRFRDQRTILDVDRKGNPLQDNVWVIPGDGRDGVIGPQKLWLVLRDGRYGIDWREFDFAVAPE